MVHAARGHRVGKAGPRPIDLDPATNPTAQEWVKAARYFTKGQDGLSQLWFGRVWLNPPYSYPLIERFARKLIEEHRAGKVNAAILLVNSRTSARWFHDVTSAASAMCVCKGRIRFIHPSGREGGSPTLGQTFFYFGAKPDRFAAVFSKYGLVSLNRRGGAA